MDKEIINNGLKISEMIKANNIRPTSVFPIVQDSLNKKITIEQLAEFLGVLELTSDFLNSSKSTSASAYLTNSLYKSLNNLKQVVDGLVETNIQSDWNEPNPNSAAFIKNKPRITNGKDGEDGHSPVITIVNGYWYIDGVNTGVRAQGTDGIDGLNGRNGIDGTDGKDGTNGNNGRDAARLEYQSEFIIPCDKYGNPLNTDLASQIRTSVAMWVGETKYVGKPEILPRNSYIAIEFINNPGFSVNLGSNLTYTGGLETLDEYSTVATFNVQLYEGSQTTPMIPTIRFENQSITINKTRDGESPVLITTSKNPIIIACDYESNPKPGALESTNSVITAVQGLQNIPYLNSMFPQALYWKYSSYSMNNGTISIGPNGNFVVTSINNVSADINLIIEVYKDGNLIYSKAINIPVYKINDGAEQDYSDNVASYVPVYVGTFVSGTTYVGGETFGDAVKFVDDETVTYYYVKRNRQTNLAPYIGGIVNYDTAEQPDDSKPWRRMDSYRTVATELLLAQGANIGGWIFYEMPNGDQVLESVAKTGGVPNALLNGTTGYAHFAAGNAVFNEDGSISIIGSIKAKDSNGSTIEISNGIITLKSPNNLLLGQWNYGDFSEMVKSSSIQLYRYENNELMDITNLSPGRLYFGENSSEPNPRTKFVEIETTSDVGLSGHVKVGHQKANGKYDYSILSATGVTTYTDADQY